jgi:PLP dependent protein
VATIGPTRAVQSRLAAVQDRIAESARRAGRDPAGVTLIAVSKTFPTDLVREAVEAGALDLGENRVQEAESKVDALPATVRWHLIGHLQSNKVAKALELFELIHSVDTIHLGEAISRRAAEQGRHARVLLQVNLAEKESQFGFTDVELSEAARGLARLPGLSLDGLMGIAPLVDDAEMTRPYFRHLAALHSQLRSEMQDAGHPWDQLSMGMTNDFSVAIEEGSTLVRVGRAIFGERG